MRRTTYLLWLPIAFLTISVHGQVGGSHLLNARNALASEIEDVKAEFGDVNIDTSLDGYDHELVARSEREGSEGVWEIVKVKAAKLLKPKHKIAARGEESEEWEPISKRDLIEHQRRALEAVHGDTVDYSLDGYDESLLDEEGDEELEKRGEDDGEEIDYSLDGYDETFLNDDLDKRDDEGLVPEEEEEGVDYSLDGYDTSILNERDLGEDENDGLPEGDGSPYDADFDSKQYLTSWDPKIHARDFADDETELLGTAPDAEYGPEDDDVDLNDRYFESEGESDVVTGVVRRDVKEEDDEDEDADWLDAVKRWAGWE